MSKDAFYHVGEGVSAIVTDANSKIKEYETIINNIRLLINRINNSTEWLDVTIKTAYIEKCSSYISYYEGFIKILNDYVSGYLSEKSEEITNIEGAYS